MAAHSNNFIRVRLFFDYPPPAVIGCRMCWLLVDLNSCRVVADLESLIREKFEFSRGSILSLFMEDCYLPHTESIFVVRDNDSVRCVVKVDCVAQVNGNSGCPESASEKGKKRPRPTEETGAGENGVSVEWKKKRRKKGSEEKLERDAEQASVDERTKMSQGKRTEKKKRKKADESGPTVTPKPAASTKNTPVRVEQPVKGSKKPPVAQANKKNVPSSDSSSSSSEEIEAPKRKAAQKLAPKATSSTAAASKTPPTTKPTRTKPKPPSSSSSASSSSSSSDEANGSEQAPPPAPQATNRAQEQAASVAVPAGDKNTGPCTSSSEEEIELVIRRPIQPLGHGVGGQLSLRGLGRGKNWHGGPGERGRGRGRGGVRGHNGSFEISYNESKEPSYQTDSLTNMSVVLQNAAGSAPKKNYSCMPLLAAPPQVGQTIAFKLLELTENYTPEVSDYKVSAVNHAVVINKNISHTPVEPGKFDLVYQNPDGSERVEYAVSRDSRVCPRI
uniref:Coilin p80 n=1 Tax=Sparus aurata TaxID=8175 RepID=A0A671UCY0_SPAAU